METSKKDVSIPSLFFFVFVAFFEDFCSLTFTAKIFNHASIAYRCMSSAVLNDCIYSFSCFFVCNHRIPLTRKS